MAVVYEFFSTDSLHSDLSSSSSRFDDQQPSRRILETSRDLFKGRTNFHWGSKTYRLN